MAKQTGKGSRQRREAAFERKAVHHHKFVGEADAERAEAELRKRERLDADRNKDTVREMAQELEKAAGLDGAAGPELRIPRSLDEGRQMLEEGKQLLRDAPDALREKARERLDRLPEPARKAIDVAQSAAGMLFARLRAGLAIAREVAMIPFAMLRMLRRREA